MKQHIDKAYQAAIALAAVLARTNGRSNTAASEVLTDAKVIFDEGFIDVIGNGAGAETSEAIERFKSAMMSSIEIAATRKNVGRILPETIISDAKVFYADITKHTGDYVSGAAVLKRNDEELISSTGTEIFEIQSVRFEKTGTVAGDESEVMPQAWGIYQRMEDGRAMHIADFAAGAKYLAEYVVDHFKDEFRAGRFDPMNAISSIEAYIKNASNLGDWEVGHVFDLNPELVQSSFINPDGTVPIYPWNVQTQLGLPVLEVDGVAWSRHNIEKMIADDPETKEEFGAVWDDDMKYIYEVRALAEKVYREVKEGGFTPVSAWQDIKDYGINAAFYRAAQAKQRAPRQ